MEIIGSDQSDVQRIGGVGVRVQFDETSICNGRLIVNPSSALDDVVGTQWIICGVVHNDCRSFF